MQITFEAISYLITVLSLVAAVFLYLLQRNKKQLSYEFIRETPLILSAAASTEVSIAYRNQELSDPRIFLLRFVNTGTAPILPQDFETPLRVDFQPATVVSVTQSEASEDEIRANLVAEQNSLTVTPGLLNSGDWFAITALLDGQPVEPRITGRIVGVTRITPVSFRSKTTVDIVSAVDLLRERSRASAPIVAVGLLTTVTIATGLLTQLPTQLSRRQALLLIISSTVAGGLAAWQTATTRRNKT
jgi:hypothetical protein